MSDYLLDTHALLWALLDKSRLPKRVRMIIESGEGEVFISAVTAMELATKFRIGKLPEAGPILADFESAMLEDGFQFLSISTRHSLLAGSMKGDHKDPFDRFLIAQSICDGLTLVSNEALFDSFGVNRLWR
jgi:PIN domain nuclease of toxin-antitoxin system